ncbi:prepilin-type N-terminal cleavage/methylation domain-containing protein [Candidatus Saccharibacteria bacterium]|nr:prepilin-type N-terminal cleavage/methylation domain-containing protein [Candidatus Saccharibacteria bacterium]
MATQKKQKKAFTIIEFMLAMTFLAILLMGITTVTMRILDIYRKGLSIRAINATGRDILNDMTRTIGGSPIVEGINPSATIDNGIANVTRESIIAAYRKYYNEIAIKQNEKNVQAGGVFCTGSYSYVWNNAPVIEKVRKKEIEINNIFTIAGDYYKLARIPDVDRKACERVDATSNELKTKTIDWVDSKDVVSLISDDDADLALYDFVVLPATQNNITGQILYSGTFILGTMRGGVNVLSNGDFCTGADTMYSDEVESTNQEFNYCSVNKFNFAMRATGESSTADQYGER